MKFTFTIDDDRLIENLEDGDNRFQKGVDRIVRKTSREAQKYAKKNAPWQDHTFGARQGLYSEYENAPGLWRITVGHGVYYGIYLETHNGGKFAIIMPTIEYIARYFFDEVESLMDDLWDD